MSRIRLTCLVIAMTVVVLPFASRVQAQTQVQAPLTAQAPVMHEEPQPQYETATKQRAAMPQTQVGDATTTLLAIQRTGRLAAPAQPMLGVEADAAYRRYLKSFDHPIPAQLNSSVGEVGAGAGTQN